MTCNINIYSQSQLPRQRPPHCRHQQHALHQLAAHPAALALPPEERLQPLHRQQLAFADRAPEAQPDALVLLHQRLHQPPHALQRPARRLHAQRPAHRLQPLQQSPLQLLRRLGRLLLPHPLVHALLLRRVDLHQVYLRRRRLLACRWLLLLLVLVERWQAVVAEVGLAEGHVAAAAGLLLHELEDKVFEQVEEEDEVLALGLLPEHLLRECLVDAFLRLGPVAGAGDTAVEERGQEDLYLFVADCLLVGIGAQPEAEGAAAAAVEDAAVGDLLEDAPQHEEVEEGVGGPALGQEAVEEAQAGLLGDEVVEGVDEVDEQLLGPEPVALDGDDAAVEPLGKADGPHLRGLLLVLLPEALVAVLHQLAKAMQRHPLRVHVDLDAAVQLLQPPQLAHPHRPRQLLLPRTHPLLPALLLAIVLLAGSKCGGVELELSDVLVVLLLEVDVGVRDELDAHLLLGLRERGHVDLDALHAIIAVRYDYGSVGLALAGQPAHRHVLLGHHLHPDQREQPPRHRGEQEALQLVPQRPVTQHHVPEVLQRARHALLRAHAEEVLLEASHCRGHVRGLEAEPVDFGLLLGQVRSQQVHVGLGGGVGVVQRERRLPWVKLALPATDPTLMMAHFLPVRWLRSSKSGMKRWVRAARALQLRLSRSIRVAGARLVKLSSTSTPALLTRIEMSLKASSCGSNSSAFSFRPSLPRSATISSTFTAGYSFRISWRTACSLASVRASRTTLKPSLASCSANSLPMPSEEPVTSAQLFSPQRSTRLSLRWRRRRRAPQRRMKRQLRTQREPSAAVRQQASGAVSMSQLWIRSIMK